MRAVISTETTDPEALVARARHIPGMTGQDLVKEVTTDVPYFWREGKAVICQTDINSVPTAIWPAKNDSHRVVAFDFGIKFNIEMMYLADELFKHKNKTFTIHFGKPIEYTRFDRSKKHIEWAQKVKDDVYKLVKPH